LKKVDVRSGDKITFILPMPKSWSKKKKEQMYLKPATSRPDLDNLIKALWDAVHNEDKNLWKIGESQKLWGYEGEIIIEREV